MQRPEESGAGPGPGRGWLPCWSSLTKRDQGVRGGNSATYLKKDDSLRSAYPPLANRCQGAEKERTGEEGGGTEKEPERKKKNIQNRQPGPRWGGLEGKGCRRGREPRTTPSLCKRRVSPQSCPAALSSVSVGPGGRRSERRAPGALLGGRAGEAEPPRRGGSRAAGRGRDSSPAGGRRSLGAAASPSSPRRPHSHPRRCQTHTQPLPAGAAAAGDPARNSLGRGLASPRPHQHRGQHSGLTQGPRGHLPAGARDPGPASAPRTAPRTPFRRRQPTCGRRRGQPPCPSPQSAGAVSTPGTWPPR